MKITKLVGDAEILGQVRSVLFDEYNKTLAISGVSRDDFEKIVDALEKLQVAVVAAPRVPLPSTPSVATNTPAVVPAPAPTTVAQVAAEGNGARVSKPQSSPGNLPPEIQSSEGLRPVVDYVVHKLGKKTQDEIVAECVRMRESGEVPFLASIAGNFDKRVRNVAEAVLQADDPKFS